MKVILEVDFDLSVKHDAEFLDWYNENPDKLKDSILCGYYMVSKGIDSYCQENTDNKWINKYVKLDNEFKQFKETSDLLFKNMKCDFHNKLLNNEEMVYWRDKHDLLNDEYKTYIKSELKNIINKNQEEQIQKLKAELNIFKNTNQYKGEIGEKTIQDILRKYFIGYEVKDMSGSTSMSDIHLVDIDGNIIVIECKNKTIITPSDIEKSLHDIKEIKNKYNDKFIGYLFISMNANNIPKKGDIHYEFINNIPVIWYATNKIKDEEIYNFIKILNAHKHLIKDTSCMELNEIKTKMNNYMLRLFDNRKSIEQLKSSIDKIQKNEEWIYDDIFEFIGEVVCEIKYECKECKLIFGRKNELTRHNNKTHINQ
jgi:hypothetical protein